MLHRLRLIAAALGSLVLGLLSVPSCAAGGDPPGDGDDGAYGAAEQGLESSDNHPKCATGQALKNPEDPCVVNICAGQPACCKTAWSSACVTAVGTVCALSCAFGYTMSPMNSGLCLDLGTGGTTLVQRQCSGADAQRFFVQEDPAAAGTYRVRNKSNNQCLQAGASGTIVALQPCAGVAAQRFTMVYRSSGAYQLANTLNGNCLKVSGAGTASGVPIVSEACKNKPEQLFRFDF